MSISELAAERQALGLASDGDPHGRTISERAGDDPEPEATEETTTEQEELFVFEQGRRVTLSQMIGRGTPVEYRFNLRSKSLKGGGDMGLLPFSSPDITLVVPARQGKVEADPTYGEDGEVTKITVRANFRPLTAHDAESPEGRALLGLGE